MMAAMKAKKNEEMHFRTAHCIEEAVIDKRELTEEKGKQV